jgi:precorrin-6B methylase 2
MTSIHARRCFAAAVAAATLGAGLGAQTATQKPFQPSVGQAGKDVVWVPTPSATVNKMLDLARISPADVVLDLGSGDGITVITAARRGARGMGVEFNPDMVALSRKNAEAAGVAARATFTEGDLFKADLAPATVITLFLLPSINMKLRPQLLDLKPGTRVVSNTFTMEDWEADETATVTDGCTSWCTALLWIVPAKVAGTWQMPGGPLTLTQTFQKVSGTLGAQAVTGQLHGAEITLKAGSVTYTGTVSGTTISGRMSPGGAWSATKR